MASAVDSCSVPLDWPSLALAERYHAEDSSTASSVWLPLVVGPVPVLVVPPLLGCMGEGGRLAAHCPQAAKVKTPEAETVA